MRSIQRTNLQDTCVRTLARAAQAEGAGSRHERRSAARRFVKRHRRNTSYLRWVLRSVAASSALAVTLLGLGAQTASAAPPTFEARPSPLAGEDVGDWSAPVLGDLDGDGDLDLISGDYHSEAYYYENTGSATSPVFVERTGAASPVDAVTSGGYHSRFTLGDLDDDGDLDLVNGDYVGTFDYWENTGSAASPVFVQGFGAANPFDGLSTGEYIAIASPTLGDIDGDGDLDLVAGSYSGAFYYYENTGSAASPVFVQRTGAANPLDGQIVLEIPAPRLVDLDGDGDLDLVVGQTGGIFSYYENTGSAASPVFVPRTGAANPLDGEDVGIFSTPTLGDLDGDGDLDLISGERYGTFLYYENTTPLPPVVVVPALGTPARIAMAMIMIMLAAAARFSALFGSSERPVNERI